MRNIQIALLCLFAVSLTACPAEETGYTETKYPIVLAHGLFGFESIAGIMDYWYGIPAALQDDGAEVYVTQVSAVNSSSVRGEQLIDQIENILAISGASKVNLIGHSQGVLDARYAASVRPDLIASVTGIAGPNKGTPGFATAVDSGIADSSLFTGLMEGLGSLIQLMSGSTDPLDAAALADELSLDGFTIFNTAHPQGVPTTACGDGAAVVNGIRYYSWSGTGTLTNPLDILDIMFAIVSLLGDEENDGLVGRCSSHLGVVIRDNYNHNHLDEVNLMFGLVPLFEQNPKEIFRTHANRLKNEGL